MAGKKISMPQYVGCPTYRYRPLVTTLCPLSFCSLLCPAARSNLRLGYKLYRYGDYMDLFKSHDDVAVEEPTTSAG